MKTLDSRAGDVLRVKFKLGLFDHPYVEDPKAADRIVHNADATEMGLKMNRESMVLLKNENNLLPLNKSAIKRYTGNRSAGCRNQLCNQQVRPIAQPGYQRA